jgi:nucleoside-diphosphate-sugar epimerase
MKKETVLLLGSGGQVGTDLTDSLREIYGQSSVIASDIKPLDKNSESGPYLQLDVLDKKALADAFTKYRPTHVYHLAALLSATAEQKPKFGWELNMDGLFNVFDACLEFDVKRVFWPSSIAVFGPNTPRDFTPQYCVMDPNTIYGISKLAGERYCEYYHKRYGLDVRSIRYPGLIGWKALPGGGTTDYAVEIFHEALKHARYNCFLGAETSLPMMYMDDAIKATIDITEAPSEQIKIRSSYNVAGMSFNPQELAEEIKKHIPNFEIDYQPDHRQKIADSWPKSIDDTHARQDWAWQPDYDTPKLVSSMLTNLKAGGAESL